MLKFLRAQRLFGTDAARRSRASLMVLVLSTSLTLGSVTSPAGYAFAAPPQDEAPPTPPKQPKQPKQPKSVPNPVLAPKDSFPPSKADQKQGKEAYKRGLKSDGEGNWQAAFDAYSDAVNFDPTATEYGLHQAIAKGHVVQMKIDAAEKAAVAGDLTTALRSLREARELDPTNKVLAERLAQMEALRPNNAPLEASERQLAQPVQLDHLPGKHSFQIRSQTQGAYEQ